LALVDGCAARPARRQAPGKFRLVAAAKEAYTRSHEIRQKLLKEFQDDPKEDSLSLQVSL
jgi:hypothetical protein